MGFGIALGGGFFPPRTRLAVILRDTLTVVVENTEFELRGGVACRCALLQVGECLGFLAVGGLCLRGAVGVCVAGCVVCGQGVSSCSEKEGKAEGFGHGVLLGRLGVGQFSTLAIHCRSSCCSASLKRWAAGGRRRARHHQATAASIAANGASHRARVWLFSGGS